MPAHASGRGGRGASALGAAGSWGADGDGGVVGAELDGGAAGAVPGGVEADAGEEGVEAGGDIGRAAGAGLAPAGLDAADLGVVADSGVDAFGAELAAVAGAVVAAGGAAALAAAAAALAAMGLPWVRVAPVVRMAEAVAAVPLGLKVVAVGAFATSTTYRSLREKH